MINDSGGVDGRKLKLIAYDDSYDPTKTEACFNRLMEQKVFALGFFVALHRREVRSMAESNKIPLIGLFTGAQTLYAPLRHWVVNVRASYFDETRETDRRNVGNAWLQENRCDLSRGCLWRSRARWRKGSTEAHGAEPSLSARISGRRLKSAARSTTVKAASPDAVVVVGPSNTVAPILQQSHAKGWKPLFLTVSFVGTDELIREAGLMPEMVITQVVPPYYLTISRPRPLSPHADEIRSLGQPNFVSLEGFVDAMVLVEGIKKAGKDLNARRLIRGIESIHGSSLASARNSS